MSMTKILMTIMMVVMVMVKIRTEILVIINLEQTNGKYGNDDVVENNF